MGIQKPCLSTRSAQPKSKNMISRGQILTWFCKRQWVCHDVFTFIPHLLSVLLPSSPCLNFIQIARFARELGISKSQDWEYPEYQVPASVMKKKKKPQAQPPRKRRANLAMTPYGDASADSTFTSHWRTHTGVCHGPVDPSSATDQPHISSFKLAQSGSI